MPRVVKFALRINDKYIDTLEDLKNNFDIEKVIGYFNDGRLLRWLKVHRYEEEAAKVESIEIGDENLTSRLYEIFCIEPPTDLNLDVEDTVKRHHRLERLKTYTNDPKILSKVDNVAFDQNELDSLIKNDVAEIYLCNGEFVIPLDVRDKIYIGIHQVVTIIESEFPVDFEELNIQFQNISFDKDYEKLPKSPEKMFEMGESYYKEDNYKKAVAWYKKAADKGNVYAMRKLGDCYGSYKGYGIEHDDKKAAEWCRRAADTGNDYAMYALAYDYYFGSCGVKQDYKKAIEWFQKAADNGYAQAMFRLADYYHYGECGLEHDDKKAIEWFQKAADNGHTLSMYDLGYFYEVGSCGVKRDYKKAIEWYKKAADAGDHNAKVKLKQLGIT